MTLIIDPQTSGIAGNMIIGALIDLGADENYIKEIMEKSANEFGEVKVSFEKINKKGIASTYCNVEIIDKGDVMHFDEFIAKIQTLDLDEQIKETSISIFTRIAKAEAKVHGSSLEKVHFHEVGQSDAVADVIGAVSAYYSLKLNEDKIIGLPISVGGGRVKTAHGILPVPAPAVVEILKEGKCVGGPVDSELATPTGCAIYMELVDEIRDFIPQITPLKIGYGAGKKEFDFPNVLRVIQSEKVTNSDEINVIETNIDHLTGEELGYLFDLLLEKGARDVSLVPILMKKNRPGHILKVIAKKESTEQLIDIIFREVGTLGIRIVPNLHRGLAKREFIKKEVEIDDEIFEVTYKVGYVNGNVISSRIEFEDAKKIALQTGIPLKDIINRIGELDE
ncbi:MAG: nickel pincer cofactor biosynthesis protein LarC [Methanobrevibacter sp.]|uniref:nickel pincer cofactor biosynthesis protein LarC n=1 Tax=Methanobrevibacter sp. TaxID=66852 RepID=UPI0026E0D5BE|nr:nickel pincer cofactor biosynthesis protein LarC [Methanobrevibacter sp.]MDO5848221.1 nickel pincer cofactor biosynthesis protein LarC [Methanobrevibacter sp.]